MVCVSLDPRLRLLVWIPSAVLLLAFQHIMCTKWSSFLLCFRANGTILRVKAPTGPQILHPASSSLIRLVYTWIGFPSYLAAFAFFVRFCGTPFSWEKFCVCWQRYCLKAASMDFCTMKKRSVVREPRCHEFAGGCHAHVGGDVHAIVCWFLCFFAKPEFLLRAE